ncbi:MAG: bifunctional [glutamate--ammonia ligase]-adenylyl-L-tyrosine phosphorylase/[glutamate--ammonia-ligase] adenylyltransferase [Xanthomonadales bacterium]|nr:bifunctional [glutamate--ammonia ligase]-adenylyl-L-tyrosine phosphorylase/[glutamate--ammonia-ligase] adenylyltransferase [Xanthomonadales bacterium]
MTASQGGDRAWLERRITTLAMPDPPPWLPQLLLASDFAHDVLRRDGQVRSGLEDLVNDSRPLAQRCPQPVPADMDFAVGLRRFRRAQSLRLITRDLLGLDTVEATLAGSSELADICIGLALEQAGNEISQRHGVLLDAAGEPSLPIVFALGKLGGRELNFSSDVDLVLAYREGGPDSLGPRPLAPDAWHARLVQRLVQLLGEVSEEGFVHRVDLRLRPFGRSGRLSLPLAAMELYFQREGRDWERYAWLKARVVAGDIPAGEDFLATLRPFVYRRYLDYNALDALRQMKAQIDLEVKRQDLADDIKLGPGGIREIEFLVQVVQLVRGGREPELRRRGLLPALAACARAGYIDDQQTRTLHQAYLFLRRLENRLQMFADAQTHALPEAAEERERIAGAMGHDGWPALLTTLDEHRRKVRIEFAQVLGPDRQDATSASVDALHALWQSLMEERIGPGQLAEAGIVIDDSLYERLRTLAGSPGVRALSARSRRRLDRLMAALLGRLREDGDQRLAASAVIDLLQVLLRRSNYLALLAQQPAALQRLLQLAQGSRWLIRHLIEQPLLLDDVFDPRTPPPPDRDEIVQVLAQAVAAAGSDPERILGALAEARASLNFRLGLATIDRSLSAPEIADRLAAIAEGVVAHALVLALADTARVHGWPDGADPDRHGLVLVGYGSVGAAEMGFASDLDLVFLFDPRYGEVSSTGRQSVEGHRFYARAVQKLIAYLAVPLPGGRLYEIDPRLRPDGAKGGLVTSLESWVAYQQQRAWTWEQQALVRSRIIAGDPELAARFVAARRQELCQPRQPEPLAQAVLQMRARLRQERDRSAAGVLDLKQGRGGLVDLEFILQYLVLAHASRWPELAGSGNTRQLLALLSGLDLLPTAQIGDLVEAHAVLLQAGLACTLDDRSRVVSDDGEVAAAAAAVASAWQQVLGQG